MRVMTCRLRGCLQPVSPSILFIMISFQDFSILCLNVRGAVNVTGRRHARELVKKHNPSMIILIETHCAFSKAEKFWSKLGYVAGAYSEANGHFGGIWILVACAEILYSRLLIVITN